jgi:hypothetical protein
MADDNLLFAERQLDVAPTPIPVFPRTIATPHARITTQLNDRNAVIVVSGEVDLANASALRVAIQQARSIRSRRIIIDAAELDFLAVPTARELVAAKDITIMNAYGISKRVLDLIANEYSTGEEDKRRSRPRVAEK